MQVLLISQVIKRNPFRLFLIKIEHIPPPVLPLEHEVKNSREHDEQRIRNNNSSPQSRIMLSNSLRNNQLRTDNVPNSIPHESRRGSKALLRIARDIGHAETDDQTGDGRECAEDGVAGDRGGGVVEPSALPDHGAACDDGEAAGCEHDEADVWDFEAEVAY